MIYKLNLGYCDIRFRSRLLAAIGRQKTRLFGGASSWSARGLSCDDNDEGVANVEMESIAPYPQVEEVRRGIEPRLLAPKLSLSSCCRWIFICLMYGSSVAPLVHTVRRFAKTVGRRPKL